MPDAKEDGEEEEEDSEEMDDDLEAEAFDFKATGRSRTKLNSNRTIVSSLLTSCVCFLKREVKNNYSLEFDAFTLKIIVFDSMVDQ